MNVIQGLVSPFRYRGPFGAMPFSVFVKRRSEEGRHVRFEFGSLEKRGSLEIGRTEISLALECSTHETSA